MAELRWQQRFRNFDRAFVLLREALDRDVATLSQLEQEGVIQRFEFTFELSWKVLKDYLEHAGIAFAIVTPRTVIKEAFAARLVGDGQAWIDMLDQRNLLSHTYDHKVFLTAIERMRREFLPVLDEMHLRFAELDVEASLGRP